MIIFVQKLFRMYRYLYFFAGVFTLILGFSFYLSYSNLSGHQFIYPLDDAYIHLALSRNVAENGIWGINPNSFDSASSSILYTLLLSLLIKIFGDNVYYPLFINIICGYVSLYYIFRYFYDYFGKSELLLGLSLFIFSCQMNFMVLKGMEQTLHILLTVTMIYYLTGSLRLGFTKKQVLKLLLCTALLGAVRFESMFFIVILSLLLVLRKNWKIALAVFFVGFLPILLFGIYSIEHGGYFFPNSLLMKGNYPESNFFFSLWTIFKNGILLNISFYKLFLAPLVIVVFYFLSKYKITEWYKIVLNETVSLTVVGTVILHSLFAVIRYRYENYLMAAVIMVTVPMITYFYSKFNVGKTNLTYKKIMVMAFSIMIFYSFYTTTVNYKVIKYASKNIEEQQIEMSRLLGRFYKNQNVVVNDIGAIAYFSNVKIYDIAGLATTDVAGYYYKNKDLDPEIFNKKYHNYMASQILQKQCSVAVIYPKWFPDGIPKSWIPIASWTIEKKMGVANQTVVWYAMNQKEAETLLKNLKIFDLNKNVTQHFLY